MKYCTHCGKELLDEAVICMGCGCAVDVRQKGLEYRSGANVSILLNSLSQRINTNGIIWLIIGILQTIAGLFVNWFLLIVGVLNIISSVNDMNYSKTMIKDPKDIIAKFEPLTGPIVTLIYNLVFGGIIGVIGSIYYFVAIRSYIMENKVAFSQFDTQSD